MASLRSAPPPEGGPRPPTRRPSLVARILRRAASLAAAGGSFRGRADTGNWDFEAPLPPPPDTPEPRAVRVHVYDLLPKNTETEILGARVSRRSPRAAVARPSTTPRRGRCLALAAPNGTCHPLPTPDPPHRGATPSPPRQVSVGENLISLNDVTSQLSFGVFHAGVEVDALECVVVFEARAAAAAAPRAFPFCPAPIWGGAAPASTERALTRARAWSCRPRYSFGFSDDDNTGVYSCPPRASPGYHYRLTVGLGW